MSAPLFAPDPPRSLAARFRAALLALLRGLAVILVGVLAAAIVFFLVAQLGIVW